MSENIWDDLMVALVLQEQEALLCEDEDLAKCLYSEEKSAILSKRHEESSQSTDKNMSIVDKRWDLIDPTPDIRALFVEFNRKYFWSTLDTVEVRWSPRMTLCAGLCVYEGRGGLCSIRLSEPLLKLRPRKDLVETLLDHDGHGPEFQKHMHRLNKLTSTNITIYHSFHDEVASYQQHWWRCDGPCQNRQPFFGYVKRAMNRAPSARDFWWAEHKATCNGTFHKIKEPEGYAKRKTSNKTATIAVNAGNQDIRSMISNKNTMQTKDHDIAASSSANSSGKFLGGKTLANAAPIVRKLPGLGIVVNERPVLAKADPEQHKTKTNKTLVSSDLTIASKKTAVSSDSTIATIKKRTFDSLNDCDDKTGKKICAHSNGIIFNKFPSVNEIKGMKPGDSFKVNGFVSVASPKFKETSPHSQQSVDKRQGEEIAKDRNTRAIQLDDFEDDDINGLLSYSHKPRNPANDQVCASSISSEQSVTNVTNFSSILEIANETNGFPVLRAINKKRLNDTNSEQLPVGVLEANNSQSPIYNTNAACNGVSDSSANNKLKEEFTFDEDTVSDEFMLSYMNGEQSLATNSSTTSCATNYNFYSGSRTDVSRHNVENVQNSIAISGISMRSDTERSSEDSLVQCPVCGVDVLAVLVNEHLDNCLQ